MVTPSSRSRGWNGWRGGGGSASLRHLFGMMSLDDGLPTGWGTDGC